MLRWSHSRDSHAPDTRSSSAEQTIASTLACSLASRVRSPATACTRHSRGYLHHLFKAGEMLGPMLLTWHNVTYYQDLMRGLREAIAGRRLDVHAASVRSGWVQEDVA